LFSRSSFPPFVLSLSSFIVPLSSFPSPPSTTHTFPSQLVTSRTRSSVSTPILSPPTPPLKLSPTLPSVPTLLLLFSTRSPASTLLRSSTLPPIPTPTRASQSFLSLVAATVLTRASSFCDTDENQRAYQLLNDNAANGGAYMVARGAHGIGQNAWMVRFNSPCVLFLFVLCGSRLRLRS
jgi:hypothetical protein